MSQFHKKSPRKQPRTFRFEGLESRAMMAIRPIVPPSFFPTPDIKTASDSYGASYELRTSPNSGFGSLKRCIASKCETIDGVKDFAVQGTELRLNFADGTTSTSYVQGEVATRIANSAAAEANAKPVDVGAIRGIIGNVSSEPELIAQKGRLAPRSLLDNVGRIDRNNLQNSPNAEDMIGTGTVLSYGGNQYVLTAAHVVEDCQGNQLPASDFKFVIQAGDPPQGLAAALDTGEVYQVQEILGRSYFNADLALLALKKPVTNVIGAYLPNEGFSPQIHQQVMTIGYGYNNQGRYGVRNFGYTDVERITNVNTTAGRCGTNGVPMTATGPHIEYTYDSAGEAAFASGDSGGPDFIPEWIDNRWIPRIVGVHSYAHHSKNNSAPSLGDDSFFSVPVTQDTVTQIREAIAGSYGNVIDFSLHILDDGDSNISGCGEWRESFTVDDQPVDIIPNKARYESVCDGDWITEGGIVPIGSKRLVNISMSGVEQDGSLFNGRDEVIPQLPQSNRKIYIPDNVRQPYHGSSGPVNGEVAYELTWEISRKWIPSSQRFTPDARTRAAANPPASSPEYSPLNGNVTAARAPRALSWRNPANHLDIDNDGHISPADALRVINQLNANQAGKLKEVFDRGEIFAFLDADGDGSLSPMDALLVINHINAKSIEVWPVTPVATKAMDEFFDTLSEEAGKSPNALTAIQPLNVSAVKEISNDPIEPAPYHEPLIALPANHLDVLDWTGRFWE